MPNRTQAGVEQRGFLNNFNAMRPASAWPSAAPRTCTGGRHFWCGGGGGVGRGVGGAAGVGWGGVSRAHRSSAASEGHSTCHIDPGHADKGRVRLSMLSFFVGDPAMMLTARTSDRL